MANGPLIAAPSAGFIFSPGGRDIKNWIKQFVGKDWKIQFPLRDDDYRWDVKHIDVVMSTTTTSGTDTYEVPNTHIGLITKISGHLAIQDWSTETQAVSAVGNPSPVDRLVIKGQNCRVRLQNADKGDYIIGGTVGGGEKSTLADFMRAAGGEPVAFDPPHIVSNGEVLEMALDLQDTASDVVGGSTRYGLQMQVLLIRIGR